AQLRSVEPPLSESEITRERLSLEEAVRKVESEAAQRAREVTRPGAGGDRARAGGAFRASTRPAARPGEGPPAARPNSPSRNGQPGQQDRNGRGDAAALRPQPQVPLQDPQLPAARDRSGSPRRGPDNNATQSPGMRGFRDIAADADDLGAAAAQASRSARKTYANVPSPSPEF